ncbi:B3 domain-containing protein Os01g0905400-like isoform X2 [Andrographis paniculata]|uniref:B3 domain-containing protein Os01g0905400-like isoform X2 n=1 Tax=Andrographis paniculata TaxID=175694 RepID=UPI0021E7198D|nr:B3 domain-containing protein Os01g0905400-like isoform X2 [Andrographis paniculata]
MACRGVACEECTRNCKTYHKNQNGQPPVVARFFKVIYGKDCSRVLYVPPEFTSKVKHLVNQKIQLEDSCEQHWSVTLYKDADDSLVFRKGWKEFFQHHNLKEGEFLVFNYMRGNHFIVQIFGKSACERFNFKNEKPQQNKRPRRVSETDGPHELFEQTNINLRDKSSLETSVASGREAHNSNKQLVVNNANFEGPQFPFSANCMEDLNCMINRTEGYQGEEMGILFDLSAFEMGNTTKQANMLDEALETDVSQSLPKILEYADKFGKAIDMKVASTHPGGAEQSNIHSNNTQNPVVHTNMVDRNSCTLSGMFNQGLNTKIVEEIVEQQKRTGHDNQIAVDLKDGNGAFSGDIFTKKFENDSHYKVPPCAEISGKSKTKNDSTETATVRTYSVIGQSGGILSDKLHTKQSELSKLSKDGSDITPKFLHGNDSILDSNDESDLAGCATASKENTANQSLSFSAMFKNSLGKHCIKKELVELKQEPVGFPVSYCGKEPNTDRRHDQVLSTFVKIEPDTLPSLGSFSVEVKTLSYLELPVQIPSGLWPGRRERGAQTKAVYVKDPQGRVFPVLYLDESPKWVLADNWSSFCEWNNIKVGDKCSVEFGNDMVSICKIDYADDQI